MSVEIAHNTIDTYTVWCSECGCLTGVGPGDETWAKGVGLIHAALRHPALLYAALGLDVEACLAEYAAELGEHYEAAKAHALRKDWTT